MADIRPFAGLRYNPARIALLPDSGETTLIDSQKQATAHVVASDAADTYTGPANTIAHLIAPPYDVIDAQQRAALVADSPYNIVRLELPEGTDRYAEAARLLHEWIAQGVLAQDEQPAFYIYDEEFIPPGATERLTRRAIYAAVRLYDWAEDVIMPHEGTMNGPKADRLALLQATRTNLSPIFVVFDDADNAVNNIINAAAHDSHTQGTRSHDSGNEPHREWAVGKRLTGFEFEDAQGNRNRLTPIADPVAIAALSKAFADKKLYIADGHHRYETALTYRNEQREKLGSGGDGDQSLASDFVMMTLSAQQDPGLCILPTHRLVTNLTADARAALDAQIAAHFTREDVPLGADKATVIEQAMAGDKDTRHLFGAYGLKPGVLSLLRLANEASMHSATNHSAAWQTLDVAILEKLLLEDGLGMTEETLAQAQGIVYAKEIATAVAAVDAGEAQVAFFLLSTRIEEVLAVADAHDRMPRKSTYFYPKLPTGVVVRILDPVGAPRPTR